VGGLQVRDISNPELGWITIENEMGPNDIVIFSGQTLTRITSGLYRPILHRASTPPTGERYSIVFFLRAQFTKRIESVVKSLLPSLHSNWIHSQFTGSSLENKIRQTRNICKTDIFLLRYISYQLLRRREAQAYHMPSSWTIEL